MIKHVYLYTNIFFFSNCKSILFAANTSDITEIESENDTFFCKGRRCPILYFLYDTYLRCDPRIYRFGRSININFDIYYTYSRLLHTRSVCTQIGKKSDAKLQYIKDDDYTRMMIHLCSILSHQTNLYNSLYSTLFSIIYCCRRLRDK